MALSFEYFFNLSLLIILCLHCDTNITLHPDAFTKKIIHICKIGLHMAEALDRELWGNVVVSLLNSRASDGTAGLLQFL